MRWAGKERSGVYDMDKRETNRSEYFMRVGYGIKLCNASAGKSMSARTME